jgi:ATPase family AAA domain-containing protein 3A/B
MLEKTSAEGKEYRETVLEGIGLATSTVGKGLQEFIMDREKLINTTVTLTGIAFGLYTARVSTGVVGRFIEARLGKPSLVRETTKKNVLQMIASPISSARLAFGSAQGDNALKNIVLEAKLDQRLRRVAHSTANTKKNNAPFRHLLLYGPPGTGKTMFAKGLAKESGLHYAILTGGDVAPLGKEGVTEIHKLFDWAQTTRKGVLLFVDEADAFLRKRSTEHISEDVRNALNAFLYRTGEASQKFMVVYASNQPEQFDWAINDRIDDMIEFALPEYGERMRMLSQYMDQYLLHPPQGSRRITVEGVDEEVLGEVATKIEGYSGREISKLAIAWQAAAYGTDDTVLDVKLLNEVLVDSLQSKFQKRNWLSEEEVASMARDSPA